MTSNLTEILLNPQLQERVISYILHEILNGLMILHMNHRVHRDIKSDNIMLNEKGEVKLGDFGFAVQLTEEKQSRDSIVGSTCWMAPELVLGLDYDTRVDIWSLGIVALELANGTPPYFEKEYLQAMLLIATNPAPRLEKKIWSKSFCDFVDCCLVKDPEGRPDCQKLLKHQFISNCGEKEELVKIMKEN